MISMFAFRGALELGFVYALMALGLFISFRVLDIADLTVDGSFTLGAVTCAMMTVNGYPIWGLILGTIAGGFAGCFTALLQTKLGVTPILAGIITMTGLYSINIRIMGGKPNTSLAREESIFTLAEKMIPKDFVKLFVVITLVLLVAGLLIFFLYTKLGLQIRATGDNEDMVRSSSINADLTKTIGLAIANGLVALSGATLAQFQKFADINMGIGMVVIGLASIIIGEALVGKRKVYVHVISIIVGSVIYRLMLAFVLEWGVDQQDIKLFSALLVALAISFPTMKKAIKNKMNRKRGTKLC